jgi:hypothetical protein
MKRESLASPRGLQADRSQDLTSGALAGPADLHREMRSRGKRGDVLSLTIPYDMRPVSPKEVARIYTHPPQTSPPPISLRTARPDVRMCVYVLRTYACLHPRLPTGYSAAKRAKDTIPSPQFIETRFRLQVLRFFFCLFAPVPQTLHNSLPPDRVAESGNVRP